MASITITDACGTVVTATIRNTTDGDWVEKSSTCGLSGSVANYNYSSPYAYYELIVGGKKQYQETYCASYFLGQPDNCEEYQATWCADDPCYDRPYGTDNCIDGEHTFGCYRWWTNSSNCYISRCCMNDLKYFEWECL